MAVNTSKIQVRIRVRSVVTASQREAVLASTQGFIQTAFEKGLKKVVPSKYLVVLIKAERKWYLILNEYRFVFSICSAFSQIESLKESK